MAEQNTDGVQGKRGHTLISPLARYSIGVVRRCLNTALTWREYFKFMLCAPKQWRERMQIIRRFRCIHRGVTCGHSEWELLPLASEILKIPRGLDGDILECGIFKGGGTCKLSVVAKIAGRKLLACDSFAGLPEPKEFDARHRLPDGRVQTYKQGDYQGTIDEVRNNINLFGEPDVVELIPGWFNESLPELKSKKFVFIFIDVDLYDSIVCCIENLYPLLQPGCKFFTHEAGHSLTRKAFTDKKLWMDKLGIAPLDFNMVNYGLGLNGVIGYLQKPLGDKASTHR